MNKTNIQIAYNAIKLIKGHKLGMMHGLAIFYVALSDSPNQPDFAKRFKDEITYINHRQSIYIIFRDLQKKGLIEEIHGKTIPKTYKLTSKGRKFIDSI